MSVRVVAQLFYKHASIIDIIIVSYASTELDFSK